MKTTIFIVLTGFTLSCTAQRNIASLESNAAVKANLESYIVVKQHRKVSIENIKNKLNGVKQNSPNLPLNISLRPYYIKLDLQQLTIILAKNIAIREMESLANIKNAGILIDLRVDVTGKILEVSFFTDDNSTLNLKQLEIIENEIKKASQLIVIKPEIERYIKGSNFLLVDTKIYFENILKIKRTL